MKNEQLCFVSNSKVLLKVCSIFAFCGISLWFFVVFYIG